MSAEPVQVDESRKEMCGPEVGERASPGPAKPVAASGSSKRVLEPIERISEVLFGLIMVLTFTCSFSVAGSGHAEIRNLLLGALGCNLAWGIIDAIMYLMGSLAEKARTVTALRAIREAANPEASQQLIAATLPPAIAATLGGPELEVIRRRLEQMPAPNQPPRLNARDWLGAAAVFLLVFLSTFPVVIPFACMEKALRAQRISNAIAIGLMFLTGHAFGRCTGYHPRAMGIIMVVIGGVLVALTILLGG